MLSPVPTKRLKGIFPDPHRAQERHHIIARRERERGANRLGVYTPHDQLQFGSEPPDEIEAVAGVGNTRDGAREVVETGAQHVLDDGAGDGGPDGGAELGEDVEAGGGDGLVGLVDVVDWGGRFALL